MKFQILYSVMITISCLIAVFLLMSGGLPLTEDKPNFRRNRFARITKEIKSQAWTLEDKELNAIFKSCGISISSVFYRIVRLTFLSMYLGYMLYVRFKVGGVPQSQVILWLFVLVVTYPKLEFFGMKTPFNFITSFLASEYKNSKNIEVFRAISQLKNLSIAQSSRPVGAIFVIQELMKYSKITKPIFSKMLGLFYQNRQEEAVEYFTQAIGTRQGVELGNLFLKLDKLNPVELKEQLEMYQEFVTNEKRTAREKRNEYKGYVIYTMVITSVTVVFFNFMMIVLFIDTLENLSHMTGK